MEEVKLLRTTDNRYKVVLDSLKCIMNKKQAELANRYGIKYPNGCLLFGGNKRERANFVSHIANYMKLDFLVLDFDAVEGIANQIIDEAYRKAPVILAVEGIDKLSSNRNLDKKEIENFEIHFNHCMEFGVFCMVLTDSLDLIDLKFHRFRRECGITNDLCFDLLIMNESGFA